MFYRVGFAELIIVLVYFAIIGGLIYAVFSLIHHNRSTSERLQKIEKILEEMVNKDDN